MKNYQTNSTKKSAKITLNHLLSFSIFIMSFFFLSVVNAQETKQYFLKEYNKKLDESYFFNANITQNEDGSYSYNAINFSVGCQPGDAFSRGMTLGGFEIGFSVDGEISKEDDYTIIPLEKSRFESHIFEDENPTRMAVRLQYLFKKMKKIKVGENTLVVEFEDSIYKLDLIK